MAQPRSVVDIVIGCKIPISTVYRRVHELEKAGYLLFMVLLLQKMEKSIIYTRAILKL
jgi:DNA-binding Lrp family transcriptional regulator